MVCVLAIGKDGKDGSIKMYACVNVIHMKRNVILELCEILYLRLHFFLNMDSIPALKESYAFLDQRSLKM